LIAQFTRPVQWVGRVYFAISQRPQAANGLTDRYGIPRALSFWNARDFAKQRSQEHEPFPSLWDAVA
jgi:hypothetical protein